MRVLVLNEFAKTDLSPWTIACLHAGSSDTINGDHQNFLLGPSMLQHLQCFTHTCRSGMSGFGGIQEFAILTSSSTDSYVLCRH